MKTARRECEKGAIGKIEFDRIDCINAEHNRGGTTHPYIILMNGQPARAAKRWRLWYAHLRTPNTQCVPFADAIEKFQPPQCELPIRYTWLKDVSNKCNRTAIRAALCRRKL